MSRWLENIGLLFFAIAFILFLPFIVYQDAVAGVCNRIEKRWPESYRAQAISFWIKLLAPFVPIVVLFPLLLLAIAHVRSKV